MNGQDPIGSNQRHRRTRPSSGPLVVALWALSAGGCFAPPGDDGALDQTTDRLITGDSMANPIAISLGPGESTFHGSTSGATTDGPAAGISCAGSNVWYAFNLTQREVVYADTAGSNLDTSLYVVDSAGNPVAGMANDDASCTGSGNPQSGGGWLESHGYESAIAGELAPGTYRISVGGCATGNFTLHVQHMPATLGSYLMGQIHADYEGQYLPISPTLTTHTASSYLAGASRVSGLYCGGSPSGEDVRWFTSCGNTNDAAVFSLCQTDGGTYSRARPEPGGGGTLYFDPVLDTWNGLAGDLGECNDDGAIPNVNPPFNCQGTGGDTANYGSRLRVYLHRGINAVIVDER
jgi:hypothetical protein